MLNREIVEKTILERTVLRKVAELFLISLCLYVAITSILFVVYLYSTPSSKNFQAKKIYIEKGTSFRSVVDTLHKDGIISSKTFFNLLAYLTFNTRNIKAGEYVIPTPQKPLYVLNKLVKGLVTKYYITIPEGSNIYNISSLLDDYKIAEGERFLAMAGSREVAKTYGIESRALEGYLFPDTYVFTRNMDEKAIINMMTNHFNREYSSEMDERRKELGLTMDEVITIASIIEKETSLDSEKPIIAAIIYRRLKKNMRLQMDPTVIYGFKKWNGRLTKKDLNRFNEFNTYVINGLPPGPISNPGRASIIAALYPADTNYLYFVSKNDGSHHFSRTLREHINAVNRYQKINKGSR